MGFPVFRDDIDLGYDAYPQFLSTAPKHPRSNHSPSASTKKSIKQRPASPAKSPATRLSHSPSASTKRSIKPQPASPPRSFRTSLNRSRSDSTKPSLSRSSSLSSCSIDFTSLDDLVHHPPYPKPAGPISIAYHRPEPRSHHNSRPHRGHNHNGYYPHGPGSYGDRYQRIIAASSRAHFNKGQDLIDSLDLTSEPRHHEGPYDAVHPARNKTKYSPMDAVKNQTAEHAHAHPRQETQTEVASHRPDPNRPLFPPGTVDNQGFVYNEIDEGANYLFDTMRLPGYKFTEADFANDPFYTDPYPEPIARTQRKLAKLAEKVKAKSQKGKKRLHNIFPKSS
ncbi:Pal1 cell morphology protein [Aspergillus sclerotialis]|uniref:Pal1 cell morphology protein n=1 Tax=Aspergillus sclerotialis TaxID=2070753 RepID=A0A3A2ZPE0_9EURO|nr:Pal1 cell morphology protein [Aspergillus sclerotialis]